MNDPCLCSCLAVLNTFWLISFPKACVALSTLSRVKVKYFTFHFKCCLSLHLTQTLPVTGGGLMKGLTDENLYRGYGRKMV